MRWGLSTPGSPEYVLPIAQSTSVAPVPPFPRPRLWMINLEAVIERPERCTWRPRSSELRDTLWGHYPASLEMHLEAEIDWSQRCTLRPWSSEFGDAIGVRDWVNSEMHREAVIERVRTFTSGGVLGSGRFGGRRDGSWDSIHWWICNCGNEERWVQQHPLRDRKLAGSGRLLILGWCCTWCMLYSVLSNDHGMERWRGMT